MPLPPFLQYSLPPGVLENVQIVVPPSAFDQQTIFLTDARRTGIMLRDKRLTLRDNAALTHFLVEAVSDSEYVLQATTVGKDGYSEFALEFFILSHLSFSQRR